MADSAQSVAPKLLETGADHASVNSLLASLPAWHRKTLCKELSLESHFLKI